MSDRPESLITLDAHPGNFLVDKQGWPPDGGSLKSCRISYPGFEPGHSTLVHLRPLGL